MEVLATERAADAVRRVAASGREDLVVVLGTGCCDSTAPYLYDRYLPAADAVRVGDVAGVPVFAPAFLDRLYPGGEGLVLDAEDDVVSDSLSLESEQGCRLVLRLPQPHPPPG
jgi:uncharacterized protein (DUF779 family)